MMIEISFLSSFPLSCLRSSSLKSFWSVSLLFFYLESCGKMTLIDKDFDKEKKEFLSHKIVSSFSSSLLTNRFHCFSTSLLLQRLSSIL